MPDTQMNHREARQKTVVAFVAGLLIGGLLVWVFSASDKSDVMPTVGEGDQIEVVDSEANTKVEENNDSTPTTGPESMGDVVGSINVSDQAAGSAVMVDDIVYPADEGWVGVRDYKDGELSLILGVVRFSAEQQLLPKEIILQRATVSGETYAAVFYTENSNRQFDPRHDIMVEDIMDTFMAQ